MREQEVLELPGVGVQPIAGLEVLIEAGAVEDSFYAILTGRVQVVVNGRVLVEAGPGSTVGELAVLIPEPRSATVVTMEPSGFLRVRKATIDNLVADHPAFATSIMSARKLTRYSRFASGPIWAT